MDTKYVHQEGTLRSRDAIPRSAGIIITRISDTHREVVIILVIHCSTAKLRALKQKPLYYISLSCGSEIQTEVD